MINKTNHPRIEVTDWIKVEGANCVISQVYGGFAVSGACEVVTNPDQPINRDVCWDGQQWLFSHRPTLTNATNTSRLKKYVALLQQGQKA